MNSKASKYIERYLTRMLYFAPIWIVDGIANKKIIFSIKDDVLLMQKGKRTLDSDFNAIKQWIDGYVATTPIGDPSAVGSINSIIQH